MARGRLGDGVDVESQCDTLITSAYEPVDEVVPDFFTGPWHAVKIGDCVEPRRLYDAIEDANLAVMRL